MREAAAKRNRANRENRPARSNELCAEIHNRMPVILKHEAWPVWLAEQPADEATLKSLLAPYPSDGSLRVGNVNNNDPSLIEPIALP